jgi:hypothetical protein
VCVIPPPPPPSHNCRARPTDRAFNTGKYHTAFLYAVQASSIRDPGNLWRVENVLMRESRSLYAWRALRLLGFAANRVGEWAVCADALAAIGARRPADEIAARWRADCVARMPQTGGAAGSTTATTTTATAHDSMTSELLGVISARALGATVGGDGKVIAPVTTRTARPRLQPDRAAKKPSILVSLATDISSGSATALSPFVWGAIGGASGASLCMAAIVAIRKLRAARAKRV